MMILQVGMIVGQTRINTRSSVYTFFARMMTSLGVY